MAQNTFASCSFSVSLKLDGFLADNGTKAIGRAISFLIRAKLLRSPFRANLTVTDFSLRWFPWIGSMG